MTLWIVGCSITHGVGIEKNQRWGELVARELNIPLEFLSAEGSSIEWASDQILRADIQTGDIVLWGITSPNRYVYYDSNGNIQHIHSNHHKHSQIHTEQLIDINLAYKAVNYIKQVENYLFKIGCKYSLGYILSGLLDHRNIIIENFKNNKNFFIAFDCNRIPTGYPGPGRFVDSGTDGLHPGPKQHKIYAELFLKNLTQNS